MEQPTAHVSLSLPCSRFRRQNVPPGNFSLYTVPPNCINSRQTHYAFRQAEGSGPTPAKANAPHRLPGLHRSHVHYFGPLSEFLEETSRKLLKSKEEEERRSRESRKPSEDRLGFGFPFPKTLMRFHREPSAGWCSPESAFRHFPCSAECPGGFGHQPIASARTGNPKVGLIPGSPECSKTDPWPHPARPANGSIAKRLAASREERKTVSCQSSFA